MDRLEILPTDLTVLLASENPPFLLDCREAVEYGICRLPGAELIPMNSIPAALTKLEAIADERPIIVYCHHGMRSLNATAWLRRQGIENVQSLAGGIDRWSLEIDPSVPRY